MCVVVFNSFHTCNYNLYVRLFFIDISNSSKNSEEDIKNIKKYTISPSIFYIIYKYHYTNYLYFDKVKHLQTFRQY